MFLLVLVRSWQQEQKQSSYLTPILWIYSNKTYRKQIFTNFNDVICGGIHNAFSTYVRNAYEDLTFEDYLSILQNKSTNNEQESVLTKEYNSLSCNEIIELEKQKLIYFITTYSQKVVLADSGEKNIRKEFYGYEFSNRRGSEGIYIYKDEEGNLNSKLYNPEFEGLEDPNKLNSYILRNYKKDSKIEQKIAEIQISDDHPLKEHIHYVRLSQLISFDLKKFDKSINLNKRDNLKIESKWKLVKLGEVCEDIISGSTPSKRIREYWNSKDINCATIKDFTSLYIENTMQHISRKGLDKVRIVPVNSVLLSCTGR